LSTNSQFVVTVTWHKDQVTSIVRTYRHAMLMTAVGRAIGFAKVAGRAMACGSPELHGRYTVEAYGIEYYNSGRDPVLNAFIASFVRRT
jgi:hypothetical protein